MATYGWHMLGEKTKDGAGKYCSAEIYIYCTQLGRHGILWSAPGHCGSGENPQFEFAYLDLTYGQNTKRVRYNNWRKAEIEFPSLSQMYERAVDDALGWGTHFYA